MIQKRITTFLLGILVVVAIGTAGYFLIFHGQERWIDCLYMTVISITSVGYGEILDVSSSIAAQIFTMGLITFGMGFILYAISSITAFLIEGELSGVRRRRRMNREINRLTGHIILVGGGETGRPLANELLTCGEQVVIIEQENDPAAASLSAHHILFIEGDPTDDANLEKAGIDRAKGVVIALPQDKDSLYVTMTARMMNKDLRIVAQVSDPKMAPKFTKAGADSIVSPNTIGALRMASEMVRPAAVDFLDQMLRSEQGPLRIHELPITPGSPMDGRRLSETDLRREHDLLVLGLKDKETTLFNPKADTLLASGMTLVVMGNIDEIKRLQARVS
ncbi:potassium channel family protein [Desulfoluna butyratoxydans]|uniref:Ion channel n=1 Tax=Desulfoluna butyratoxydans TaxID=231438 RepID=A0A4U8YR01_9BACT|nr:potassium channel protein [Desulfoluna butyratoxydans]VFQ45709.1 ion channel [Desulfoluna butyratoxydans]